METTTNLEVEKNWSNIKKISFRFFFSYFALFIFTNNNGSYPFFNHISTLCNKLLYEIIPSIGKSILGINYKIVTGPNGSGDTTYDYVVIFTIFVLAIIATIIWSLIDKKSTNYKKLYYWLTVAIRFYIGLMLINYGVWKLIKLQFGYPSMKVLTQTFGESSPMRLAWTFLGFSKGYNIFMGLAEVAAIFLLFRRTLSFGLIITLATTANVMAVNYFYDVPVKITSTHLVLMTLFLFAYNFKELCDFFFFKKTLKLSIIQKPNFKKTSRKIFLAIKVLLISCSLGLGVYGAKQAQNNRIAGANDIRIKGFYEVESFLVNKDIVDYKSNNGLSKWKYLMLKSKKYAMVKYFDSKTKWYRIEVDSIKDKMILTDYRDSLKVFHLNFEEKDSIFHLNGTFKKDTISIKMKKHKDFREKFMLTNTGFNWINEYPNNR